MFPPEKVKVCTFNTLKASLNIFLVCTYKKITAQNIVRFQLPIVNQTKFIDENLIIKLVNILSAYQYQWSQKKAGNGMWICNVIPILESPLTLKQSKDKTKLKFCHNHSPFGSRINLTNTILSNLFSTNQL